MSLGVSLRGTTTTAKGSRYGIDFTIILRYAIMIGFIHGMKYLLQI